MVMVGERVFFFWNPHRVFESPLFQTKKQNSSAIIIWHTSSAIKNHAVHDGTCPGSSYMYSPSLEKWSHRYHPETAQNSTVWAIYVPPNSESSIYNHVHKYLLGHLRTIDATQSKRSHLPPSPSVPRPQPHARRGDARSNCSWRLRRTCHVPGHETGIKLNLHPPFTVGELTWTHLEDRKTFYTTSYAKESH